MKKLRNAFPGAARLLLLTALFSCLLAMLAFASDAGTGSSVDITGELVKSFQSMADTMIATIFATVPVVMSVVSALLCIQFGIRFFKRFAK